MKLIKTPFDGLFVIESPKYNDARGSFQKIFNKNFFISNNLEGDINEIYYSVNNAGVMRGMHFQLPPDDHAKIVYVTKGTILDGVIDLRKSSPNYGKAFLMGMSEKDDNYLYIPRGFAHGFLSLEDGTIVNYAQTSVYSPGNDCGISLTTCGINWNIDNPIISERDKSFINLSDFQSPFE